MSIFNRSLTDIKPLDTNTTKATTANFLKNLAGQALGPNSAVAAVAAKAASNPTVLSGAKRVLTGLTGSAASGINKVLGTNLNTSRYVSPVTPSPVATPAPAVTQAPANQLDFAATQKWNPTTTPVTGPAKLAAVLAGPAPATPPVAPTPTSSMAPSTPAPAPTAATPSPFSMASTAAPKSATVDPNQARIQTLRDRAKSITDQAFSIGYGMPPAEWNNQPPAVQAQLRNQRVQTLANRLGDVNEAIKTVETEIQNAKDEKKQTRDDAMTQLNLLLKYGALDQSDPASLQELSSASGISLGALQAMNLKAKEGNAPEIKEGKDGNFYAFTYDPETGKYSTELVQSAEESPGPGLSGEQLNDALAKGYKTPELQASYAQLVAAGVNPDSITDLDPVSATTASGILKGDMALNSIKNVISVLDKSKIYGSVTLWSSPGYNADTDNLTQMVNFMTSGAATKPEEKASLMKLLPSRWKSDERAKADLAQLRSSIVTYINTQNKRPVYDASGNPINRAENSADATTRDIDSADFPSAPSKAVKGSTALLSAVIKNPVGSSGGQCGRYVNKYTGLGLGDSYESKMAKMNRSIGGKINPPRPGDVFVMPYRSTGHTGFVVAVQPLSNGTYDLTVSDSNWGLDERVQVHKLNSSKISGYARPSLKSSMA